MPRAFQELQEIQAAHFQLYAAIPVYLIEEFVHDVNNRYSFEKVLSEAFCISPFFVRRLLEQIQKRIFWNIQKQEFVEQLKTEISFLIYASNGKEQEREEAVTQLNIGKDKKIIARDNNTYRYCGKKLNKNTRVIDHVIPWSRGGRNRMDNLVVACKDCNSKKSDMAPEEANMPLLPLIIGDEMRTKLIKLSST